MHGACFPLVVEGNLKSKIFKACDSFELLLLIHTARLSFFGVLLKHDFSLRFVHCEPTTVSPLSAQKKLSIFVIVYKIKEKKIITMNANHEQVLDGRKP